MSGAEAALVLGLVSSVIAICEAAYDVWSAVKDSSGLPKKLKQVADELPLISASLDQCRANIDSAQQKRDIDVDIWKSIHHILSQCEESAKAVKQIFDTHLPVEDDSRPTKYNKVLHLKRNSGKVKEHVEKILHHIQTLAEYQVLCDTETLQHIRAAITDLEAPESSEEGSQVVHGDGHIIRQTGNGTIAGILHTGSGKQQVSTGNSTQYIADTMSLSEGKTSLK